MTLTLALCAFAATVAFSQAAAALSGRVTDGSKENVLRGARVTLTPVASSEGAVPFATATDASGEFVFSAPAGEYNVAFDYLGLPAKTQRVTLSAPPSDPGRSAVALGDDTLTLAAFSVTETRTGQTRALNQQRSSQNLTNIVSADYSGQFPDKNIADAVKRLPGVTVETDRDTGGSEGRYVTVRGMSADFNAVTVNGMRVNVTDFDGISRRVPLDVISSDVADQIEVTKALRPDQDADSLGGAVDIKTRSAFSHSGRTASVKAAIGYSSLLSEYTGYPYDNPTYEGAEPKTGPPQTVATTMGIFSIRKKCAIRASY